MTLFLFCSFLGQDWQEKYIHENYSRVLEGEFFEQVTVSLFPGLLELLILLSQTSVAHRFFFPLAALPWCLLVSCVHRSDVRRARGRGGKLRPVVWRKTWGGSVLAFSSTKMTTTIQVASFGRRLRRVGKRGQRRLAEWWGTSNTLEQKKIWDSEG